MITHMSSKLTDTVDCGFVLWSREVEMTVQYIYKQSKHKHCKLMLNNWTLSIVCNFREAVSYNY